MEQKQICDGCGGKIAYPAEYAGTKTNCPHCKAEITLGSPSSAKVGISYKTSASPSLALSQKLGIGIVAVVLIAGAVFFALPSKRISGVFVGPEMSLTNFKLSSRPQLDFREDGTVGVSVAVFDSKLYPGTYSISGRTISIKFTSVGDTKTMQFQMEGEDIILTKPHDKAFNDGIGYRWKRK